METIICPECGEEAEVLVMDFGIGSYEYWGARGVHTDKRWVTKCCEVEPPDDWMPPEDPDQDVWDFLDRGSKNRDFDKGDYHDD